MYEVDAIAIMPNHVHLLIKQKEDLAKIMKYIKAKSAIELNKSLGKSEKFCRVIILIKLFVMRSTID